jgi:hypothetical protein
MRAPVVSLAFALAALLAAAPVRAQEENDDARITAGVELRSVGKDEEALAVFRAAYAAHATPRALAQIGLAEQALGRWLDAEAHLGSALAAEDPWVGRHRASLDGALVIVRHHLAWLAVDCTVPGAELWVDGQEIGALPRAEPLRVVAGAIVLDVKAAGYESTRRTVDVAPEARAQERVTLVQLAPPEAPAAAAATAPAPPSDAGTQRTLAWSLGGAGLALVAGGVIANVVREENVAAYNDPVQCNPKLGQTVDDVCGDRRTTANTAQVVMAVGYAAGGAALVTSAILLLTSRPKTRPAAGVAFGCGPSVAPLAFTCDGSF